MPLYIYPQKGELEQERRINFEPKLYAKLCKAAGLDPECHSREGGNDKGDALPPEIQVFDYLSGVFHCPASRATYAEFLKIDFPRIPWPASPAEFRDISAKGNALRRLHLMEPDAIGPAPYPFRGDGDSVVEALRYENGCVFINKIQYFEGVPELSWTFPIGGYLPAQKWLKDRKGRALSFEDVKHYQRIIKILSETDRIMKTITMTLEGVAAEAG
jgi:Type ISP C-terminal specificity domain